ncbi:hypothetical protein PAUR_b1259 [Pseudoalteromonas aurantia 208]|uniref:Orphan protein n=1 Tax=Pseudoalteromonas aurantia 208 TaxID=1314867 RepID=A0ABR9EJA1_9GAMM|nr:hypothetical protein [Pseudoalteromonas aurantia 208]
MTKKADIEKKFQKNAFFFVFTVEFDFLAPIYKSSKQNNEF